MKASQSGSVLLVQAPWQHVEYSRGKTHVRLTLPGPCAEAFEDLLDCMYGFAQDPACFGRLSRLAPDALLGALWLAGRLEVAEAQQAVASHLLRAVDAGNARTFLRAAVALGFEEVRGTLVRSEEHTSEPPVTL